MEDASQLTNLLRHFDVTALGRGDSTGGLNLLATMACTLANLARDDGTVTHPDTSPARLGTSLLVMGSSSAGRVVDEITTEIGRRQNNLLSNLESHSAYIDELKRQPGQSPSSPIPRMMASARLIAETQSEFGDMTGGHAQSWLNVLELAPRQTIKQIEKQPKFLVSVGGKKDIESQLKQLRPGCPLVHLGLTHPNDLAHFSEAGSALLEGRYPLDDGTRTVKGNILITDPMHVLIAAAQDPDDRTSWLGQLLWLTDGDSGPDAPTVKASGSSTSSAWVEHNFRRALGVVMTSRLSQGDGKWMTLFADTREASVRWSGFLREMEPRLPGISGAARNLLTSLVFGLGLMIPKNRTLTVSNVEAMARFLVRRMASARTAILHAGELARLRAQITRVFHKLGSGPADQRKICRDLKMTAADRDSALCWLEEASLVHLGGNGWEQREGARLSFKGCAVPILEV